MVNESGLTNETTEDGRSSVESGDRRIKERGKNVRLSRA